MFINESFSIIFWTILKLFYIWFMLIYFLKKEIYDKVKQRKLNKNNIKSKFKSPYIKDLEFEKRNYDTIFTESNPYKKKETLLFTKENSFFNALLLYLENTDYYICPKVRLADVIFVNTKYNFTKYFKPIGTKSIDFLLCDTKFMSPKVAIYLDDYNNLDEDMIQARRYITFSLQESGVKVVRFNINVTYDLNDISNMLNIKELSS